jgi:tetratricopeptide (TPR) repeat protein
MAFYLRGRIHHDIGDGKRDAAEYKLAVADYTQSIRLNPDDAKSFRQRGLAYTQLGKAKDAAADRKKANELEHGPK